MGIQLQERMRMGWPLSETLAAKINLIHTSHQDRRTEYLNVHLQSVSYYSHEYLCVDIS
jgi:hypothetical protein